MSDTKRYIKKIVIALIGFPLIIVGLVLIPLPGPGLLICLAGLLILAREFEWANDQANRLKKQANKLVSKPKNR